ncbi:CAP domain-containing protein [Candidatus Uhrbacteria bacterium]|nr:CAP domain-containing protein [Candidatus Uhrbacteria bacterium]
MPRKMHPPKSPGRRGGARRRFHQHVHDAFIAHKGNGHVPHLLKHGALLSYSGLLLALKVITVIAAITFPSASVYSLSITRDNIIDLTNQARVSIGLPALVKNATLDTAAENKASDMAKASYFAHTSPDGKTPWTFIRGAGYDYQVAGENLAVHFNTAEDVQSGWMASPGHRANIVNEKYQEIGVGTSQGTYEDFPTTFVVQMFGTPKSEPPLTPLLKGEDQEVVPASDTEVAPPAPPVPLAPPTLPSPPSLSTPPPPSSPEPAATPSDSPLAGGDSQLIEATATLAPKKDTVDTYVISADIPGTVKSASAKVGFENFPLKKEGKEWVGDVPVSPATFGTSGSPVTLVVERTKGHQEETPVAELAPMAHASDFYAFTSPSASSLLLFGFIPVVHLEDHVKQVYLFTLLGLGALLLGNLIIQMEKRHHTIIGHSLFVLTLGALLYFL